MQQVMPYTVENITSGLAIVSHVNELGIRFSVYFLGQGAWVRAAEYAGFKNNQFNIAGLKGQVLCKECGR